MPDAPSAPPAASARTACPVRVRAALLVLAFALGACATTPPPPVFVPTGDPVIDGNARLAAAPPQDRPLWECRLALEALRRADWAEARAKLDAAILAQGGIMGPRADAAKARGLFRREDTKLFVGEPYERVMVYFYRAILYWMDGEPDNARACYLTAQLLDGDATSESYKSDWVLPDLLDAFASARLGMDGSDALLRARQHFQGTLPPIDPAANVLVFVEFGRGPRKYSGGEYGEQLFYQPGSALARTAVLHVGDRSFRLGAQDDVSFQASTRGGRLMDRILDNKAGFKETTDLLGDAALIGAGVSAYQPRRHRSDELTAGLGALGLLSKIASAATTPEADTRCWDNLPQWLGFTAIVLPPGDHPATVEFLAADGRTDPVATQQFTLHVRQPPEDTVLLLSQLSP